MSRAAEKLAERFDQSYVPPIRVARLYAYADEGNAALQWLEKAYEERDFEMVYLDVHPDWENLRGSAEGGYTESMSRAAEKLAELRRAFSGLGPANELPRIECMSGDVLVSAEVPPGTENCTTTFRDSVEFPMRDQAALHSSVRIHVGVEFRLLRSRFERRALPDGPRV